MTGDVWRCGVVPAAVPRLNYTWVFLALGPSTGKSGKAPRQNIEIAWNCPQNSWATKNGETWTLNPANPSIWGGDALEQFNDCSQSLLLNLLFGCSWAPRTITPMSRAYGDIPTVATLFRAWEKSAAALAMDPCGGTHCCWMSIIPRSEKICKL